MDEIKRKRRTDGEDRQLGGQLRVIEEDVVEGLIPVVPEDGQDPRAGDDRVQHADGQIVQTVLPGKIFDAQELTCETILEPFENDI